MEQNKHIPEHGCSNTETNFITGTLYSSTLKLARLQGVDLSLAPESFSTPIEVYKSYGDTQRPNAEHTYSFAAAYDPSTAGFSYFLAHEEDVDSQFMYLNQSLQTEVILQLMDIVDGKMEATIDAEKYVNSIRYLDALSVGDSGRLNAINPVGLHSLIRYTQRTQTQYACNDIDRVITKKILVQHLLDGQLLSEIIYGGHTDDYDDSEPDLSFSRESSLMHSTQEDLSFCTIAADIPVMKEYLARLDLDNDIVER